MTTFRSEAGPIPIGAGGSAPETPLRGPNLTLWDIEAGLNQLMEAREEATDEAGRAAVDQAIAEYCQRELDKVDSIRSYLRHCDLMEQAAKQEAEHQAERAKAWAERGKRLKAFCLAAMQAFGRTSIEGRTGKLRIRTNGGKVPLIIADEAAIPSEYKPAVVTYPVDKDAVRQALESGTRVPGAALGEREVRLEVK